MGRADAEKWKRRYYPVIAALIKGGVSWRITGQICGIPVNSIIMRDMERRGLIIYGEHNNYTMRAERHAAFHRMRTSESMSIRDAFAEWNRRHPDNMFASLAALKQSYRRWRLKRSNEYGL